MDNNNNDDGDTTLWLCIQIAFFYLYHLGRLGPPPCLAFHVPLLN